MKKENLRIVCLWAVVLLWAVLTAFAWFGPKQEMSEAERRPLAQAPDLTVDTLLGGSFMKDFEKFSLDQFPMRDTFRTLKSLFHYHVLNQSDNNDIYMAGDYAVKQEYPLHEDSLTYAIERLNHLYEKYLKPSDGSIHLAMIPDKGYYLHQESGNLALDYEKLFSVMETALPWANPIDLTDCLAIEDYYHTDIHWRQENLVEAAGVICDALGVTAPKQEDFRETLINRPFYGVYYGQAALPMEPENLVILESDLLDGCTVYDFETGKTGPIYDMEKAAASRDLYDVYLSGAKSLLTIENPRAATDRELLVFRDSFGSSMVPLLLQDYAKVTLVDIRYIQIDVLDRFLDFDGQEVLMMYSVPVLNNSQTIK